MLCVCVCVSDVYRISNKNSSSERVVFSKDFLILTDIETKRLTHPTKIYKSYR